MSIFSRIKDAIFGSAAAQESSQAPSAARPPSKDGGTDRSARVELAARVARSPRKF